jgi:hypothetical protein
MGKKCCSPQNLVGGHALMLSKTSRSVRGLRIRSCQQKKFSKFNITKMLPSKEGEKSEEDREGKLPNLYSLDRPKDVVSGVTDVSSASRLLIFSPHCVL